MNQTVQEILRKYSKSPSLHEILFPLQSTSNNIMNDGCLAFILVLSVSDHLIEAGTACISHTYYEFLNNDQNL